MNKEYAEEDLRSFQDYLKEHPHATIEDWKRDSEKTLSEGSIKSELEVYFQNNWPKGHSTVEELKEAVRLSNERENFHKYNIEDIISEEDSESEKRKKLLDHFQFYDFNYSVIGDEAHGDALEEFLHGWLDHLFSNLIQVGAYVDRNHIKMILDRMADELMDGAYEEISNEILFRAFKVAVEAEGETLPKFVQQKLISFL